MTFFTRWLVVLVFTFTASGFARADSSLVKVSNHVYSYVDVKPVAPLNSFGANAGIVVGEQAVLVVDTLICAKEAKKLIQEIRNITDLPIKYVVNTHYHFDHVFGNGEFIKMNATIISHIDCKTKMEQTGDGTLNGMGHYGLKEQDMKGTELAYPTVSFKDSMDIDLGNLEVKLLHPGASHTTGNLLVVIPGDNVLFAGDILFTDRHPFMGDADIDGWVKSLDYIITFDVKKIIPGHGPLSSKKDVADMKAYILLFDRTAKRLAASSDDLQYVVTQMKKVLPAKAGLESLIEANLQMKYMSK